MTDTDTSVPPRPRPAPLFILSFRHRDELGRVASAAGWSPVLPRIPDDAEARFLSSDARVAVVDARGALDEGLSVLAMLRDAVEANGAGLVALISQGDVAALDRVVDGGATHYLASPFNDAELTHTLRLAERMAQRLAGGGRPERRAQQGTAEAQTDGQASGRARDALTGVSSAWAARRWIEARPLGPLAAALVAATRFEVINSAFGVATGDAVLQAVARRIEPLVIDALGRGALVGRVAGAEFIVAVAGPDGFDRLRLAADRIVEAVERPFMSDGHVVTLGCRIGIVERVEGEDAPALLRRASAALAEARGAEGGAIRMLSTAEADTALLNAGLQSDLRRALDADEIEILFQPQVSIVSGRIEGAEALARWRHPAHGELGAATLFSVAEKSDYLQQLSAHVQARAAAIAAQWPEALKGLRLSINVTSADMARAGFADAFLATVDASGFPRGRLTVEITESGLIEDLGAAARLLASLRAGGCRVAIDDFGTGYSSLAYLKALPLDYLKIDKRLAQDIAGTARDRVVVRGVIDMARSLGLAVVAEGVETEEQLALLAAEGCNYYQGFLCSEPVDVATLEELVAR